MDMTRFSLRTRMMAGFFSMAALTVVLAGVALFQIHHMASLTVDLHEHPLQVGYAIRDVRGIVWNINALLTRADQSLSPGQIDAVQSQMDDLDRQAREKLSLLSERYLGSQADVAILRQSFDAWKPLREEKLAFLRGGAWKEHAGEYTPRANRFADELVAKCQIVADFATGKANSYAQDAAEQERVALVLTLMVAALLVLAKVMVGLTLTNSIIKPLGAIVTSLRAIARGDFRQAVDIRRGDEIGDLAESFREMRRSLTDKSEIAEAVAAGDLERDPVPAGPDDILGQALSRMTVSLRVARRANDRSDWIKTGLNVLSSRISGETDDRSLASHVLGLLVPYLGAQIATLYLLDEEGRKLALRGSYAFSKRKGLGESVELGEGLVGQAALERTLISVTEIPEDYLRINSSFGDSLPRNIVALPFSRDGQVVGVLELGSFEEFSDDKTEFLELAAEQLAVAFDTIRKQDRVRELLERTQEQSSLLLEQQEELRASNEELEEQTLALRASEERLKQQQEELQVLNEELEEKNSYLEEQKDLIQKKNTALEQVRRDIERKARELEVTSRYKSEFLANMSHELRTPLNSLLILSRNLRENGKGHLAPDEVEAAGIIYKNGNDLLELINDILDLSKIEAGKMSVNLEDVPLAEVSRNIESVFRHLAEQKGLTFRVEIEEGLPASLRTDPQRLEQILRNLVSNAVKFTGAGEVAIAVRRPDPEADLSRSGLPPGAALAFVVSDTGIGIPAQNHQDIFEAFQQVDGSTSRRYGGTGLGLSITRELARLLGGEIALSSESGAGSTFTLYLPLGGPPASSQAEGQSGGPRGTVLSGRGLFGNGCAGPDAPAGPSRGSGPGSDVAPAASDAPARGSFPPSIPDDRENIVESDKAILIVEDDPSFATILRGLCHDKGFKALAASTGEEGLELAGKFLPTAVILDIRLPGMDGWSVLESLKSDHRTRHIPVHVVSAQDTPRDALVMGAVGFLVKPVSAEDLNGAFERIESVVEKKVKDLLLVEDNADLRKTILGLVGDAGVNVTEAETGGQALQALRAGRYDCMILDIGLSDMTGFELLRTLAAEPGTAVPPVIVYTGKDLTKEEEKELRKYADSIIVKGARSEDRLLGEVTLFLHRMVSTLPQSKQRMIIDLHNRNTMLEGKRILVVDDDMRNLFAVSKVLEEKGLTVLKAEDGARALEILESDEKVDLTLMDIMMPGMDGYEAMRRIRAQARFARLPIIALTAKAMKEDRQKCIEAGANDYLAKPVDVDKLLSMMRVWLYGK
jgi:CheY-like chemotaxis protein/signal transduction histidine kinase/HAMP domain-containing protein